MARIAWSHWQREPASPSYGSFDRQHWGWKKKDLADSTLLAAIGLCVRHAEMEGTTSALPELLDGFVDHLACIQHRNGSFDQVYPFERAPGVVYDILTPLIQLAHSPHLSSTTRHKLESVIHGGVQFVLKTDEMHGEIANHFAHYAWELLHYGKVFNHSAATHYGNQYLERTLRLFNEREGWFREYDGADAGYQTRLLVFLTRIADITGNERLWSVCERAARFIEALLMPDNALHPMLGVRSTALVYASGFERIAARDPEFAALADRIHDGWATGATPRPSEIDFENAIRLAEDAFEASRIRNSRVVEVAPASFVDRYDFADAGLHRRSIATADAGRLVLTVGSRLGGVAVVHECRPDGSCKIVMEDSGYLLHLADGTRWITRRADASKTRQDADDRFEVECEFTQSLHEDLTPGKMILLRLLNLTVLRSQWIGDLFRRLVVERLISGVKTLPVRLHRQILVGESRIDIVDRFITDKLASNFDGARLYRCRRTIANHMASSRYFQPSELAAAGPWLEPLSICLLDGRTIERSSRS